MKILIVGSDKIFAIENFYVKYLKLLSHQVIHFPAQSKFYDYYQKSLVNKVLFRSGLSSIYHRINSELQSIISEHTPDIIWIFKGMEVFPQTLKWAKSKGFKLTNFNGDNPFLFSGKGSGNRNVSEAIMCYDLHFTYNCSVDSELRGRNLKTAILPFGFDLNDELFEGLQREEEIPRICFLGNPDEARVSFIRSLADCDLPISLYGNNWNRFLTHPKIEIFPPVYDAEQWKVLRQYRVQLNLMRPHNLDSHNMRTFEVPGVGGIMLAPNTSEHRHFFENGKEVFLFNNVEECAVHARELLSLPTETANSIRIAARQRCLKGGYRYEDRAFQASQVLNSLIH